MPIFKSKKNIKSKLITVGVITSLTAFGLINIPFNTLSSLDSLFNPSAVEASVLPFDGGNGTIESPYLVSNAEQFNQIRQNTNAHYKLVSDIDLSDYRQGKGWVPINNFYGTLDGDNHTITGLFINDTSSYNGSLKGLFNYLYNSTIKNLTLENVDISGYKMVGSLAANTNRATIDNVHVTGKVYSTVQNDNSNTGGLVGQLDYYSTISNSSFQGEVKVEGHNGGGLVGYAGTKTKISASFSTGSVLGNLDRSSSIGGLIGSTVGNGNPNYVTESFSTSKVQGFSNIGGLSGFSNATVYNNVYARGDVTSNSTIYPNTGGLLGYNVYGWDNYYGPSVQYAYSTGKVSINPNQKYASPIYHGFVYISSYSQKVLEGYWDIDTSGVTITTFANTSIGKTTDEMKSENTFTKWKDREFASGKNIWVINNGQYPELNIPNNIYLKSSSNKQVEEAKSHIYEIENLIQVGLDSQEKIDALISKLEKVEELVNALPDGEVKSEFQEKIVQIKEQIKVAQDILNAKNAIYQLENIVNGDLTTQITIDNAKEQMDITQELINILPESVLKTELQNRLNDLKEDVLVSQSILYVKNSEITKSQADVDKANLSIEKIANLTIKDQLKERISIVQKIIDINASLNTFINTNFLSISDIDSDLDELSNLKLTIDYLPSESLDNPYLAQDKLDLLEKYNTVKNYLTEELVIILSTKQKGKPERLSFSTLELLVDYAIQETSATTLKGDRGKVISFVMNIAKGSATGKEVIDILEKKLH